MKYIDAEKLKAEIERRKCNAELGKIEAQGISSLNYNIHLAEENLCLKLLNFIDAIPEQPVEGPEEAAEEYAYRGIPDGMKSAFKPLADEIAKNFIAGAEWGAEHLKK